MRTILNAKTITIGYRYDERQHFVCQLIDLDAKIEIVNKYIFNFSSLFTYSLLNAVNDISFNSGTYY
jgi:hypothetical protein